MSLFEKKKNILCTYPLSGNIAISLKKSPKKVGKKSLVERTKIGGWAASKLLLKSGGGLFMSTVVIFNEIVLSSASKYKSMKYSWQKIQAPFRRPSMVEALMISSISGMLLFPFPFSILTRKISWNWFHEKNVLKRNQIFLKFQVQQQQQHCAMETPQLLLNTMSASLAVLSTCYIKFYSVCGVWIF